MGQVVLVLRSGLGIAACLLVFTLVAPAAVAGGSSSEPLARWLVELEAPSTLARFGDQAQPALAARRPASLQAGQPSSGSFSKVVAHVDLIDQEQARLLQAAVGRLGRELEPVAVVRHTLNAVVLDLTETEARALSTLPGIRTLGRDEFLQPAAIQGSESVSAASSATEPDTLAAATGAGIVIGLLGTGIDWDHLAFSDDPEVSGHEFVNPYGSPLGLCANPAVACNDKLVGVYDFTGEEGWGDDYSGHGTGIASIAAGVEWQQGAAGVAPHANLVTYRVCYQPLAGEPACPLSSILQALDQALVDGVDVLNYALVGFNESRIFAEPLLMLREAGIAVVAPAGDDGPDFASVGHPANLAWTLAVGASVDGVAGAWLRMAQAGPWFVMPGNGPVGFESLSDLPLLRADALSDDMLGCQPLPAQSAEDAVVLFERGDCPFSTKVDHAADAGAVAAVIIDSLDGPTPVMGGLAETAIPAGMISRADGDALLALMPASDAPPAPVALLTDQFTAGQGAVASWSSRGPSWLGFNLMKPNLVAPGSTADAALAGSIASRTSWSGSAVAASRVSGALALLLELHPDWTPAQLFSALETTAERSRADGSADRLMAQGMGRMQAERAARAGLFLPVESADFLEHDFASNGDPNKLNLASVVFLTGGGCPGQCSAVRRVEAMSAGSWQVSTEGDLDIRVSPSQFSLEPGQQQDLEITVYQGAATAASVGDFSLDRPGEGRIILTPLDSELAEQGLAVAADFSQLSPLPARLDLVASQSRGQGSLVVNDLLPMAEAVFPSSALILPQTFSFTLAEDPLPDNPYTGADGREMRMIDVPENALLLHVDLPVADAVEAGLFLGRDLNGNQYADPGEQRCEAEAVNGILSCIISEPEAGRWWVLVQNRQATSQAGDAFELDIAVLTVADEDYSLVVSGPGVHPGGPLDLAVYWDQPAMREGERWIGAVGISSSPDANVTFAAVPVRIRRAGSAEPLMTALFPDESMPVVLASHERHDRLFFDLPAGAQELGVFVEGESGVDASLRFLDFMDVTAWAPDTPPAPETVLLSATGSDSGIQLWLGSELDPPAPGRYYLVLENQTGEEKRVDVRVELTQGSRVNPRRGLWSPAHRLIYQGIEWQRSGNGFLLWYTYDANGLPVFFIAIAPIDESSSVWTAPLYRVTSDRRRQSVDVVGELGLTTIHEESLVMSWRLNGAHGTEIMGPDAPASCPEVDGSPISYTGHWFGSENAMGGTTVIVTAGNEFHVRYLFDDDGVGRWVVAPGERVNDGLELREFRGFCPNCESFPMDFELDSVPVGVYRIEFDTPDQAFEAIDVELLAPLNHRIELEMMIEKWSETLECQ